MKHNYKHIIFDLDRTLWDFDKSSEETFMEMYSIFELEKKGIDNAKTFFGNYQKINDKYWALYRENKISKSDLNVRRFEESLLLYVIPDRILAKEMATYYLEHSPFKKNLFPYTIELLSYLKTKYKLHILTNGFKEVQHNKMQANGLTSYFDNLFTSEDAGILKPSPTAFEFALKNIGANVGECIMIGDDYKVDILGAKNIGMDQIFVNFNNVSGNFISTYIVSSLKEIQLIL